MGVYRNDRAIYTRRLGGWRMVRVSIKFKSSKYHLSFVVDDECKDIGNIITQLIRDLNKTWSDIEDIGYKVIK